MFTCHLQKLLEIRHSYPHLQHSKYHRLANVKRFRIEGGDVIWGRDWDLTFPVS